MNDSRNVRARQPRQSRARSAPATPRALADAAAWHDPLQRLEERKLLAVDLNLTSITTLNTVVTPGNNFSATFTIKNDGDQASSQFRTEFRLSRNTTYGDADDIILGFRHTTAPITPGGQITLNETFDLPRNVLTGNYHVTALVDSLGQVAEPDENNNLRFTQIAQVIVANANGQADIDLAAVGVAATTGTYNAGQSFPGVATYRNNGAAASGAFTTIWFLSTNTIFGDADDIELAVANSPGGLPGNAQFPDSFNLQIPIGAPSGSYYFGVFVDARFDICEPLKEDNNIAFSATPAVTVVGVPTVPDLLGVEVTTVQASYEPGESISFSSTIRNAGNAVSGAFKVSYVLTIDTTVNNGDDVVLVFKAEVASLGPGESRTETRTVTIPLGAAAGAYFLAITLDPDNEVAESNEANNTRLSTTQFVSIEPPPPEVSDIVVLGGGSLDRAIVHNAKAIQSNRTMFGQVLRDGAQKTTTFRIRNDGIVNLVITNLAVIGQNPLDFTIVTPPALTTLAPGQATTFQVQFDPRAYLVRRAKVVIYSNDPDRPRFDMKVRGRGMPPASAPDIDVQGLGKSIADNDNSPKKKTGTRFGGVALGGFSERVYTIRNLGGSALNLSGPVTLTGDAPEHYTITVQPALTVLNPGQSTTFTVRFNPTSAGLRRADILIPCDDPDEPVFNFRILGTGTAI